MVNSQIKFEAVGSSNKQLKRECFNFSLYLSLRSSDCSTSWLICCRCPVSITSMVEVYTKNTMVNKQRSCWTKAGTINRDWWFNVGPVNVKQMAHESTHIGGNEKENKKNFGFRSGTGAAKKPFGPGFMKLFYWIISAFCRWQHDTLPVAY